MITMLTGLSVEKHEHMKVLSFLKVMNIMTSIRILEFRIYFVSRSEL